MSNSRCYSKSEASCKLSVIQPNLNKVCTCDPRPSPSLRQRLSASSCSGYCTTEGPGGNLTCGSTQCNSINDCRDNPGSYCVSTCPGDPYGSQCQ